MPEENTPNVVGTLSQLPPDLNPDSAKPEDNVKVSFSVNKKILTWVAAVVLLLTAFGLIGYGGYTYAKKQAEIDLKATQSGRQSANNFNIDRKTEPMNKEIKTSSGLSIKVTGAKYDTNYNSNLDTIPNYSNQQPNMKIDVDVTLKNTTKEVKKFLYTDFSLNVNFYLTSNGNAKYSTLSNGLPVGSLQPGETKSGNVSFLIYSNIIVADSVIIFRNEGLIELKYSNSQPTPTKIPSPSLTPPLNGYPYNSSLSTLPSLKSRLTYKVPSNWTESSTSTDILTLYPKTSDNRRDIILEVVQSLDNFYESVDSCNTLNLQETGLSNLQTSKTKIGGVESTKVTTDYFGYYEYYCTTVNSTNFLITLSTPGVSSAAKYRADIDLFLNSISFKNN
jgi:hypothetical protein